MLVISVSSLSGGQGKSCCSLFLGRYLARQGKSVLLVDGDPQHSLTTYLDVQIEKSQPTLLEVINKTVDPSDAIYKVDEKGSMHLIPSDNELIRANDFLSESGAAVNVLRQRLKSIIKSFHFCIIDSPPQRSQLAISILGAANFVLIPVEASVKGYVSLITTLSAFDTLKEYATEDIHLLGVVPFRDRWFGYNQSSESKQSLDFIREEVKELLLPSIRESERFKQAINKRQTLTELGYPDLEYPFQVIAEKLGVRA